MRDYILYAAGVILLIMYMVRLDNTRPQMYREYYEKGFISGAQRFNAKADTTFIKEIAKIESEFLKIE